MPAASVALNLADITSSRASGLFFLGTLFSLHVNGYAVQWNRH
jgi:hypothetical protein